MHNTIAMPKDTTTSATTKRQRQSKLVRYQRRQRIVAIDIHKQQCSTRPVMPYVSFSRVVREILDEHAEMNMRGSAMRALQVAAEDHLTEVFSEALRLAHYQKRETVVQADIRFIVGRASQPNPPAASLECLAPVPDPLPCI